jgi:putative phosphoserine phosphatase/1-acylglycerol-3-phosphate O-acyltransferase
MVIGAFFDMDHTLLRDSSGLLYVRYLRETGRLSWGQWAGVLGQIALYAVGVMDFPRLMGRLMIRAAGASEEQAWQLSDEWFETMLRHYIAEDGRRQVAWHQAQGHHVALVSAATPYAVRPVARAIGLGEAYLATRLEVVEGYFTGRVLEPACYGAGKVALTYAYAISNSIDLRQSYFYSDSHHDLPLLEAVGHPVAVNPSRTLARIAAARGWPVQRFY